MLSHMDIQKAVTRSQHCQRNWDLTRQIPDADLELIKYAATNCPSKQNVAYYDVYFITNRDMIEKIHAKTNGFFISEDNYTTNPQVLANLLIVFTEADIDKIESTEHRNLEVDAIGNLTPQQRRTLEKDRQIAIGIAAGYVNLTSSILGLRTGCCSCFTDEVSEVLGTTKDVKLLMGVGFADDTKPRREHQLDPEFTFPTKKKQKIRIIDVN